jgi:Uri superfamily endonuclease
VLTVEPGLAAAHGTYALLLKLERRTEMAVGRLGATSFPAGYYVYVGSALGPGGLAARLARHGRSQKKLFWHIDYFLTSAQLVETLQDASGQRLECSWARTLMSLSGAQVVARGFGASDCRCSSHLIFVGSEPRRYWHGPRQACQGSREGHAEWDTSEKTADDVPATCRAS